MATPEGFEPTESRVRPSMTEVILVGEAIAELCRSRPRSAATVRSSLHSISLRIQTGDVAGALRRLHGLIGAFALVEEDVEEPEEP
jgi:hypothetical protein